MHPYDDRSEPLSDTKGENCVDEAALIGVVRSFKALSKPQVTFQDRAKGIHTLTLLSFF